MPVSLGRLNVNMRKLDIPKLLFFVVVSLVLVLLVFGYGFYSSASKNWAFRLVRYIQIAAETVLDEQENLTGTRPKYFLQPAHHEGSGVTVNEPNNSDADQLILLSGFFDGGNELRLIQKDGVVVARWPVKFSEIFLTTDHVQYPPATDWNIDLHGAVALPNGSVVFNFEYGGLVKLDRCGNTVWKLAVPSHHSVEIAEDGGFWVPGRRFYEAGETTPLPLFVPPFREDTLMKVSADGNVLTEISVPQLLFNAGLEAVLTATGESMAPKRGWDQELVHLNKIAELKSNIAQDFSMFNAGDLMLSLRLYNMLLVIDPNTEEVKWWKIGPWIRQHDPEFLPGGTLLVFNNNSYSTAFGDPVDLPGVETPESSSIVEYDPVSDQHRTVYPVDTTQRFFSRIRGKHQPLPHGGLLITEFEAGRVLETDAAGQIIWEYINRYNEEEVAEITEARMYPSDYFNIQDWSCATVDE